MLDRIDTAKYKDQDKQYHSTSKACHDPEKAGVLNAFSLVKSTE